MRVDETFAINHLDCYRINSPEELEYIGIRDLLTKKYILLVEWAKKAEYYFKKPDILITLKSNSNNTRTATIKSYSKIGKKLVSYLLKLNI